MLALLEDMASVLATKNIENIFFKKFIRTKPSSEIDALIHKHNQIISKQIDCTACANCCKKLEPGVDDAEIVQLAKYTNSSPEVFKNNFILFDGVSCFLKTKPCMFLKENKCSIYSNRPAACADYPHLNGINLKYKSSLWNNYSVCPIVFNVIENVKEELGFVYAK